MEEYIEIMKAVTLTGGALIMLIGLAFLAMSFIAANKAGFKNIEEEDRKEAVKHGYIKNEY